jgi:Acetyltransferase (GNAT) domain
MERDAGSLRSPKNRRKPGLSLQGRIGRDSAKRISRPPRSATPLPIMLLYGPCTRAGSWLLHPTGSASSGARLHGRPRRFAIALKGSDRIIGGVGLDGSTGTETDESALGYWLGQTYWGNGYARGTVAAVIDYGFRTLAIETIRAYTDPSNAASQKVLLHCGLINVGEIELTTPTRHGARRAPLFRISQPRL